MSVTSVFSEDETGSSGELTGTGPHEPPRFENEQAFIAYWRGRFGAGDKFDMAAVAREEDELLEAYRLAKEKEWYGGHLLLHGEIREREFLAGVLSRYGASPVPETQAADTAGEEAPEVSNDNRLTVMDDMKASDVDISTLDPGKLCQLGSLSSLKVAKVSGGHPKHTWFAMLLMLSGGELTIPAMGAHPPCADSHSVVG